MHSTQEPSKFFFGLVKICINFFFVATPQRLSFQDAAGLATLQTLQASRRPELASNQLFPESQQNRRYSDHRSSSP